MESYGPLYKVKTPARKQARASHHRIGGHLSLTDAYREMAMAHDYLPSDDALNTLLGLTHGTLSSIRTRLKSEGFEFQRIRLNGEGRAANIYLVAARPSSDAPKSPVKPADRLREEIKGKLDSLDPETLAALRDLLSN